MACETEGFVRVLDPPVAEVPPPNLPPPNPPPPVGVPEPPPEFSLNSEFIEVCEGETVTIDVLENDREFASDFRFAGVDITGEPFFGSAVGRFTTVEWTVPEIDDLFFGDTTTDSIDYEALLRGTPDTPDKIVAIGEGSIFATIIGRGEPPPPPVPFDVEDDTFTTSENEPVTFNVLENDGDGAELETVDATTLSGGVLTNIGDGEFRFDPAGDFDQLFEGESDFVTFSYTAVDRNAQQPEPQSADVTIEVTGVGERPPPIPPFPQLADRQPVDPADINGVPARALRAEAGELGVVTFVSEQAGLDSLLGAFRIDEGGNIVDPSIVFPNTDGPDSGSGVLAPGDAALIGPFDQDTQLGLFLIQGGAELLDELPAGAIGEPQILMRGVGGALPPASGEQPPEVVLRSVVRDAAGELSFVDQQVDKPVFFTFDADPTTPLTNPLNTGGNTQTISGLSPEDKLLIGFEDLLLPQSDRDFNDLVLQVDFVT